tara:strand:+ start:1247 stop:1774 length:528 start_codon:yes stop_codon:yes gene_type:complete
MDAHNLLATDCTVVQIKGQHVYPIFKNGFTSIMKEADRLLVNDQIANCNNINVLIRDPEQRFISGINEYCEQNNLGLADTLQLVEQGKVTDRHFSPQWLWLLHLSKHYKASVTLRPFSDITQYCTSHSNKRNAVVTQVTPIDRYVKQDKALIKHLGETISIEKIIRICKNGLSQT